MNFIGMNFRKYFSSWKTKGICSFQLLSSRYGIKSAAVIHALVSVKAYSLSVCMAAKPTTIFFSLIYSPKLSSVMAKAKFFRSPAVRDMKSGSIFLHPLYSFPALIQENSCDLLGIFLISYYKLDPKWSSSFGQIHFC